MNLPAIQNELDRPNAYYMQIADLLRRSIESGELKPGAKLPSTQALAEKWSVNVSTIHSAMTLLVREGWLHRIRRRGTFVRERIDALRCVALYYKDDVWGDMDSAYQQSLYRAMRDLLAAESIQMRMFIDTRPTEQQHTPLPELLEAIESQQVHGVIFPIAAPTQSAWFKTLPCPRVVISSGTINYRVGFDANQLLELLVAGLVQQGCRSAGYIGPANHADAFCRLAEDAGVTINPDATLTVTGPVHHGSNQTRAGYDLACQWCALPNRPDGLIVYPDTMAAGAVQALLEHRIHVPDDLKLVLHRNAGVDLLCPFPALFVECRECEIAAAALKQLRRQFRGQTPTVIHIGYTLTDAPTASDLQVVEASHA